MKLVIIGGVAGGASAAARARRLDEKAEIILLERGAFISFANCGLPYYVGGVITDEDDLTLQTPESFRARFNVDVRVNSEVTKIDRAAHAVTVREAGGRTYAETYDKLLIATGAAPLVPNLPGLDGGSVYTLPAWGFASARWRWYSPCWAALWGQAASSGMKAAAARPERQAKTRLPCFRVSGKAAC